MARKPVDEDFDPPWKGFGSRDEIGEARARYAAYAAAGQLELLFYLSPIDRPYGWISSATRADLRARAEAAHQDAKVKREALMLLPEQSTQGPVKKIVETGYGPVEIVESRGRNGREGRGGRGGR
jgi:hypothetical protein